jgi:hypothetical protein
MENSSEGDTKDIKYRRSHRHHKRDKKEHRNNKKED